MARGRRKGEVSQKAMVAAALEVTGWDAGPAELKPVIKDKFNVELPNNVISTHKSTLKREGKGGSKRGRKPNPQFSDLEAVHGLVTRLGADQVKKLVDMADALA